MKHAQELQKIRAREAHPNMPSMAEQQMKDMLKAGGKRRRGIGEYGFIAHFEDSEGNRVALHSVS
jgi:predicted enzyme related to lactoylglutathione lyase